MHDRVFRYLRESKTVYFTLLDFFDQCRLQVLNPLSSMAPEPPLDCLQTSTLPAGALQSPVLLETWWPCKSAPPPMHPLAATPWLWDSRRLNLYCSLTLGAQVNISDELSVRRGAERLWWSCFTAIGRSSCGQITHGNCWRSSWKENYLLKKWTPGYISHVPVATCIDMSFLLTLWQQRMTCFWTMRRVWKSMSCHRMESSFEGATSFLNPHPGILARYQH